MVPSSDELIHVLLVDSNQTQSEVLASALRHRSGFQVTCCSENLSQCLSIPESSLVDMALVSDGNRGSGEPYGLLRGLHAAYPKLGLILLRDSYDRDIVVKALCCGAQGLFCRASQSFKALCRCIDTVHKGQFWVNSEQWRYVIEALMWSPASHVVNAKGEILLTAREEQLAGLVAEGLMNREIAEGLKIKENTVKKGLLRIYEKLGVSNRVELVLYALTHHDASSGDPDIAELPAHSRPARRASRAARQARVDAAPLTLAHDR